MTGILPRTPPFGGPAAAPDDRSGADAPDGTEPPASSVPRRDWFLGGLVVVLLLAILGATAGWRALRTEEVAAPPEPTTTTTPPTTEGEAPETWPIEIQPLVEFVEEHRGGPFDHPVPIEYLEEDEYEAAINAASETETEEDRAETEAWSAQLKALGLLAPDVDVEAAFDQLQGEGTLAFYDEDTDVIKVLGSKFDVAHRVTLVHELTHAWQDQHGYLEKIDDLDPTLSYTLRGMAEGDATRIEDEYIESLSTRETEQYQEQSRAQSGRVDLSGIPDVLIASLQSSYALGGPFVSILDTTGGNTEVDEALADPPPAEADLFEPLRYLHGTEPVEVTEPAIPEGAERVDDGTFGGLSWYFTLSEHNDPREVLDLVTGWAGDRYVAYRQDGRMCSVEAYRGATDKEKMVAEVLMKRWADASPALSPTVETIGGDVVLRSCEPAPGTATPPAGRSQLALSFAALKLQAFDEVLGSGYTAAEALCFSEHIIDDVTPEQMQAGAANDPQTASRLGAEAADACL